MDDNFILPFIWIKKRQENVLDTVNKLYDDIISEYSSWLDYDYLKLFCGRELIGTSKNNEVCNEWMNVEVTSTEGIVRFFDIYPDMKDFNKDYVMEFIAKNPGVLFYAVYPFEIHEIKDSNKYLQAIWPYPGKYDRDEDNRENHKYISDLLVELPSNFHEYDACNAWLDIYSKTFKVKSTNKKKHNPTDSTTVKYIKMIEHYYELKSVEIDERYIIIGEKFHLSPRTVRNILDSDKTLDRIDEYKKRNNIP